MIDLSPISSLLAGFYVSYEVFMNPDDYSNPGYTGGEGSSSGGTNPSQGPGVPVVPAVGQESHDNQ